MLVLGPAGCGIIVQRVQELSDSTYSPGNTAENLSRPPVFPIRGGFNVASASDAPMANTCFWGHSYSGTRTGPAPYKVLTTSNNGPNFGSLSAPGATDFNVSGSIPKA